MKIVVLIKQILDPAGIVVRRDKERIFINNESYIIAPGDKNGLEAALQMKDALPRTEVVAISLGPLRADEALREALAMGADAAYLLHDEVFEQVDLVGVARILATAISRINPDLIITGRESGSDAAGQIGPRLAELLDMTQITDVHSFTVSAGVVQAVRRWDDRFATVKGILPAVISVAPGVNRPRYPHGARIMNAYRERDVVVWGAAELELEKADLTLLTTFRSQSFPPPLETGERLRGRPADIAQELANILKSQKVI